MYGISSWNPSKDSPCVPRVNNVFPSPSPATVSAALSMANWRAEAPAHLMPLPQPFSPHCSPWQPGFLVAGRWWAAFGPEVYQPDSGHGMWQLPRKPVVIMYLYTQENPLLHNKQALLGSSYWNQQLKLDSWILYPKSLACLYSLRLLSPWDPYFFPFFPPFYFATLSLDVVYLSSYSAQ